MNGRIIVSKNNLVHNLSEIKKYAKKSKIMSVIKSNGYGHGMLEVASALEGSDAFAVATIEEAIYLRENKVKKEIVCLQGFSNKHESIYCSKNNIRPVIHCPEQISIINETSFDLPLSLWIKIDTGMNRLGFKNIDLPKIIEQIGKKIKHPVGVMTHLACADENDDNFSNNQIKTFENIIKETNAELSILNSAGVIKYWKNFNNISEWIRPGIMLYGVSPCNNNEKIKIKPAMTLTAPVISIKECKKGERIGYGHTYYFTKDTRIASLGIGYGDGFSRSLSNVGRVFYKDNFFNIVGRVSMDILTVDIGDKKIELGEDFELWGNNISIKDVSDSINTIPYELMCALGNRLKREYI